MLVRLDDLNPTQLECLRLLREGVANLIIWTGSVRSGKGVGTANAFIDLAVRNAAQGNGNGQYIVAGATLGSFVSNNEPYLIDIAEQAGMTCNLVGGMRSHFDLGPGLAKFFVFGGGTKRSHHAVRGLTAHSAWLDESTLHDRQFVETVIDRCSFDDSVVILTQNTDVPAHWIREEHIIEPGPKTRLLESSFYENKHYSDVRRADLLAQNPNTAHYKRTILNQWAGEEGLVYPIEDEYLVLEDYKPAGRVYLDPGTASVCAALLWVRTKYGWLVAEEYYWNSDRMGRRDDYDHLQDITRRWNIEKLVVDPSGAHMCQAARKMGLHPFIARNDRKIGIQITNNVLHLKKLRIHRVNCPNLLSEAGSLKWNKRLNLPEAGPDHALDCLRYGAHDNFPTTHSQLLR